MRQQQQYHQRKSGTDGVKINFETYSKKTQLDRTKNARYIMGYCCVNAQKTRKTLVFVTFARLVIDTHYNFINRRRVVIFWSRSPFYAYLSLTTLFIVLIYVTTVLYALFFKQHGLVNNVYRNSFLESNLCIGSKFIILIGYFLYLSRK